MDTSDPSMQPYQRRKCELSIEDGCILWGNRIIVPPPGRANPARRTPWDGTNEESCSMLRLVAKYRTRTGTESQGVCSMSADAKFTASNTMHPWEWPQRPWARLHLDYAGPFMGKMFLVTVDAHSKWLEAHVVETPTSADTIQKLRQVFATHGIPETINCD